MNAREMFEELGFMKVDNGIYVRKMRNYFRMNEKKVLLFSIPFAFLLRIIHLSIVLQSKPYNMWSDERLYLSLGKQIIEGNIFQFSNDLSQLLLLTIYLTLVV